MKKATAMILALVLILAAVPAFALNETSGRTNFSFPYEGPPNPTYTISIPADIVLLEEGNDVAIGASDVEDMDGLKVSVTVGGSMQEQGFVLTGTAPGGAFTTVSCDVITANDVLLEGGALNGGAELVSFTENGTSSYNIKPTVRTNTPPDTNFTGSMIYVIGVVAR